MSHRTFRWSLVLLAGSLLTLFGGTALTQAQPTQLYGRCHESNCSCFGFQGSGYTCTRGGCKHHYDRHY